MVPKFQVATACLSCSPPDLNSSKFTPLLWSPLNYLTFQIKFQHSPISKSQFRRLCYQALTTYHPNIFTLILSLSEGRAGIAWEPSNFYCSFSLPSRNKVSVSSPQHFLFVSTILLSFLTLSLSSASKG
jgi:hypothetical protein